MVTPEFPTISVAMFTTPQKQPQGEVPELLYSKVNEPVMKQFQL